MKATQLNLPLVSRISQEKLFMVTILLVNAGNYAFNLVLGRYVGPAAFADAALLVTFLLLLSFMGMAFQIVTTKYAALLTGVNLQAFLSWITRRCLIIGGTLGILFIVFSDYLQQLFHTQSPTMFIIFGAGLPLYFLMSINRGIYQGKEHLHKLSVTYITEMLSRFLFTSILLIVFFSVKSSIAISIGIFLSIVSGLVPFQGNILKLSGGKLKNTLLKQVMAFFAITAFYEFTQIIINNSDILLVKHYFNNEQAGLYASLALIGRVVYFIAWMFVMLLLPKAIKLKKQGLDTRPLLLKNLLYIAILSATIVLVTFLFPRLAITMMFGEQYVSMAPLLWKYALATSLFALANIFAYYFLSIGQYIPVAVSALMGLSQIIFIVLYHATLAQVVHVQIIAMVLLLFFQLVFFFYHSKVGIKRS